MKYQITEWLKGTETVISESNNKRKLWKEFQELGKQPRHHDAVLYFHDNTVKG